MPLSYYCPHMTDMIFFTLFFSQKPKPKLPSPTRSQSRRRWKPLSPRKPLLVAMFQIVRQRWNGIKTASCWYPVGRYTRKQKEVLVSWWLKRWRRAMLESIHAKLEGISWSSRYLYQVGLLDGLIDTYNLTNIFSFINIHSANVSVSYYKNIIWVKGLEKVNCYTFNHLCTHL